MNLCLIRVFNGMLFDPKLQAPLGIGSLAAVLRNAGHGIHIADLANTPKEGWLDAVPEGYDTYGISATTGEYPVAVETMKMLRLRDNGSAFQIIGGAHASIMPEQCIADDFDVAFIGEAEETILEWAAGGRNELIPGLAWMGEFGFQQSPKRELIEDLDTIPFPARDLMEEATAFSDNLVTEDAKATVITASRGCVMGCSFCSSRGVWGRTYRLRSVENIAAELKECKEKYGVEEVRFVDDQVGAKPEHLAALCEAIGDLGLKWRTHLRVNNVTAEGLLDMKNSGCVECALGCESFCQPILDHNGKGTTCKQNKDAVRLIGEAGMASKLYLIIGLPGESPFTIEQTKEALLEVRPDKTNLSTFCPYPGSPVWDNPDRYDYTIEDEDWAKYWMLGGSEGGTPFVGRTFAMSREDLLAARTDLEDWLWKNGFTTWKGKYGIAAPDSKS